MSKESLQGLALDADRPVINPALIPYPLAITRYKVGQTGRSIMVFMWNEIYPGGKLNSKTFTEGRTAVAECADEDVNGWKIGRKESLIAEDIIWHGPHVMLQERAAKVYLTLWRQRHDLAEITKTPKS